MRRDKVRDIDGGYLRARTRDIKAGRGIHRDTYRLRKVKLEGEHNEVRQGKG